MSGEEFIRTLYAQLEHVEADKRRLEAVEQSLRAVIAYTESQSNIVSAIPREVGTRRAGVSVKKERSRQTNPIVIQSQDVLRKEGKPLETRVLNERLRERKIIVGGTDPINNLTSFLSRNKAIFANFGRGVWGLREWLEPVSEITQPDSADHSEDDLWGDEAPAEPPSHMQANDLRGPIPPARDERGIPPANEQNDGESFAAEGFDDVPF